jgi:hypothetical protein
MALQSRNGQKDLKNAQRETKGSDEMSIGIFGNKCASLIHSFIDSLIHSLPSALQEKNCCACDADWTTRHHMSKKENERKRKKKKKQNKIAGRGNANGRIP